MMAETTHERTDPAPGASAASAEEMRLIQALRAGEETAFERLIELYHPSLLRLAMMYVPSRAVAEEVVQETWVGVLQGLDRFEGRSSLKTWIFRIVTNRAITRGQRESRSVPFSALANAEDESDDPAVDPERFLPAGHQYAGHWAARPQPWADMPEERLLAQETRDVLQRAIAALPLNQREVITLRDIEGWTSEEVCNVLKISETNQRVLLHRARSKARRALEQYLDGV
jgi:RNA polymerase sigma-70 factor (ECF subfamily)